MSAAEPPNGRISRSIKFHIAAAVGYISLGWIAHDQIGERIGAKEPRLAESAIGQAQAPTFWQLQTAGFADMRMGFVEMRDDHEDIKQMLAAIEARLR